MSFLKRFVQKGGGGSGSGTSSPTDSPKPTASPSPSTSKVPTRRTSADAAHPPPLRSASSLSSTPTATTTPSSPVLTSASSSPSLHSRPALITVPASLTLTAKPAAIPAKLLPSLQSSALPSTALSPTSTQPHSPQHFGFPRPPSSSTSTPGTGPATGAGAGDALHIHSQQQGTGPPPPHAALPTSPSSSSSTSSSSQSSPSASNPLLLLPPDTHTAVSSTTHTHTTTVTTTSPSDPSASASSSSALHFPISFYPPGGLPSMDPTRFNDLLTEGAGWTLEDRLVYYVHLASRIQGGQTEGWILEQIRPLCRKGVDINAQSSIMIGVTAITAACYAGYLSVVRYLLSQGADVDLCTEEGLSCVMIAVYVDHMEILKEVLTRHPSLEFVDGKRQNVLHIAVQRGLQWMVERMLPCRTVAALNQQNEDGDTPLILAVKQGHLELVQLLVGAGTDCTLRDKAGLSAFDLTLQLPACESTELMRRVLSPIPQLTLPYLSLASYCTFWSTARVPTVQPNFYRCLTCDRSGLQGICDACHSHCHTGHTMVPADASLRYYCGCGSGELCGDHALCQSRPGQQYHTMQGEEIEWPMGKMSDHAVRAVLMGLVTALGLAGSVIPSTPRDPSSYHHRISRGSAGGGGGGGGGHSSSGSSSSSSSLYESISFLPQMQAVDGDGVYVEWGETWLIAFPLLTVKVMWRLHGSTARVSAHQYSIVAEYLAACNAELSQLTQQAANSDDPWDYGHLELAPASGEVSYIIPYHAARDLITELSPLLEYNHTLANTRFTHFMAPLVRLMTTGNEQALGLRRPEPTPANTAYAAAAPSSSSSSSLYSAAAVSAPPPHPTSHHQRSMSLRDQASAVPEGGVDSSSSSSSASSSSSTSSSSSLPPAYLCTSSSPLFSHPASSSSSSSSSFPFPPSSSSTSPPHTTTSADDDAHADVDLSPSHLSQLGFDVIDSANLDLPIDPSLIKTGGGAVVIRGHTLTDATPIAFKMLHHQDEMQYDVKLRREFLEEATLLKRCSHSRVVQFMGLCVRPYGLITELLDTSLYDVLYGTAAGGGEGVDGGGRRVLSDVEVATIALEVCRGVAYLHGRNPAIIHRDIKSHNILLNRHLSAVKLCDLGIAKTKDQLRVQVQRGEVDGLGSLAWMAPECLDLLHHFDYDLLDRVDVYSIGCVLYEMLCRRIPWSSADAPNYPPPAAEIMESVEAGKKPQLSLAELSARSSIPLIWQSLMDKCWSAQPANRPTVAELVQTFSKIVKACERGGEVGGAAGGALSHAGRTGAPATPTGEVAGGVGEVQQQQGGVVVAAALTVPPVSSFPVPVPLATTPVSKGSAGSASRPHSPLRTPIFHRDSPPAQPLVGLVTPPEMGGGPAVHSPSTTDQLNVREAVYYTNRGGGGGGGGGDVGEDVGRRESGGDDHGRLHFSPGTPSSTSVDAPSTPSTPLRTTKSVTP